uniref:ATP synthase CF0 subunit I n=1 Tax=Trentepohlia sp. BN17 TaxID=3063876 RepID=UPI001EE0330E|nr:ATP synthase CF0 subunit I [Trentepohlia sp. BN17]UIB38728.1 ATP synthase CF0 subunit I [Trentepohlia sp. BN17]
MNLIEKILETNIINVRVACASIKYGSGTNRCTNVWRFSFHLTIVLVVLVSVVGNALSQSLASRKETILMNLAEADKKANEAQEKLRLAKIDFENAKNKANGVGYLLSSYLKKQNQEQAENEKKKLLMSTQNEIESLKKKKQEILELSYSQQKKELIAKISNSALSLVKKRCNFDSSTSEKIANFYLNLWTAS